MKAAPFAVALMALLLPLWGCEKEQPASPQSRPASASRAPAGPIRVAPEAGSTLNVLGLSMPIPEGWTQVPPSNSMRLAELKVAPDDPAKTCTVAFSTAGGEVQMNIDRWAGQIRDAAGQPAVPKTDVRTVSGLTVTVTEMSGTYAGMGGTPPLEGWMLRAAIIETPSGLLFIKMTGPAETMQSAANAFDSMIDGLKGT